MGAPGRYSPAMYKRTMLVAAVAASGAAGQLQEAPPAAPQPGGVKYEDLPPAVKLGVRAESVRRAWPVIPIVVVTADERSYLEAVAKWDTTARFPVLIDDGSERAREDIARFVRGFKPEKVVRWQAEDRAWPAAGAERRAMIEAAMLRSWSKPLPQEAEGPKLASMDDLIVRWKRIGVPMAGIVAADAADPAWTGALALAMGRCQPIAWVTTTGHVNGAMSRADFETLSVAIEKACDNTGLKWRALGDDLDSLAFCLNAPVKVQLDASNVAATTDLLARHAAAGREGQPEGRDNGERWGWAGQVFGSPAAAAYTAMSALFQVSKTAWVFDGYPDTQPWNEYDATKAGDILRDAKFDVTVDDNGKQGDRWWRSRCGYGIDAGFIAVNSKGMADEFNLDPGQLRPGDLPFLTVPSMVYFVHSWSAAAPAERYTVGGRWVERGAYAYLGSVHEPYLKAFVPTPAIAARVTNHFPWAAAVRPDNHMQVWKLATLGDPLAMLGERAPRAAAPLPLGGATDVDEEMRAAMTAGDFAGAIARLVMLGRDADAARLAAALRRDQRTAFTSAVAAAALPAALRAKDPDLAVACFEQFSAAEAADPWRRDVLWHACRTRLNSDPSEAMLAVLRTNLRVDQVGQDAADLARPVASKLGRDAALTMLADAAPRCTTGYDKARIEEAVKRFTPLPGRGR